jgi:hypothetical protein
MKLWLFISLLIPNLLIAETVQDSDLTSQPISSADSVSIQNTSQVDNVKFVYIRTTDTVYISDKNCSDQADTSASRFNSNKALQFNHSISTNPLRLLGGASLEYTLLINKRHGAEIFGAFGYQTGGNSYAFGTQYTWFFADFHKDPSFIGLLASYGYYEGWLSTTGKEDKAVGVWAGSASLNLFYGARYQWDNGLFWSWRIGPGVPIIWDYHWSNDYNLDSKTYNSEKDLLEKSSKIATYFGGFGLSAGWVF